MSQIGSITNKVLSSHKEIIESASKTFGNDNNLGNFGTRMEKAFSILVPKLPRLLSLPNVLLALSIISL